MTLPIRRATALATVTAAALGAPAAVAAPHAPPRRIVPFKSAAGFTLSTSLKAIRRRLGKPTNTTRVAGKVASIYYDRYKLSFEFDTTRAGNPVDLIGALGPRYRTVKHHIQVGSSRKAVRRAYPRTVCKNELCTLYKGQPGAAGTRSTGFTFFHGKVNGITLQMVR